MKYNKDLTEAEIRLDAIGFNEDGELDNLLWYAGIADARNEAIAVGVKAIQMIQKIDEALHDSKLGSVGLQMIIQACVDEVKNV